MTLFIVVRYWRILFVLSSASFLVQRTPASHVWKSVIAGAEIHASLIGVEKCRTLRIVKAVPDFSLYRLERDSQYACSRFRPQRSHFVVNTGSLCGTGRGNCLSDYYIMERVSHYVCSPLKALS